MIRLGRVQKNCSMFSEHPTTVLRSCQQAFHDCFWGPSPCCTMSAACCACAAAAWSAAGSGGAVGATASSGTSSPARGASAPGPGLCFLSPLSPSAAVALG